MKLSMKVLATAAVLTLPAAASAQSYTMFVGYVDGLRGAATFPSIWSGDANVQFFSGFGGVNPDAGAIMFQNTGSSAMFINALTYDITSPGNVYGSYSYNFGYALGSGVQLDPGKYAIFTGLNNSGDFDTSDYAVGPCYAPNTNSPHIGTSVSSTSGGTSTGAGFDDTGRILTTGGVDAAGCTGNESLGWRQIGTTGLDHPENQITTTPEPGTVVLLSTGLMMLGGTVRRRRQSV